MNKLNFSCIFLCTLLLFSCASTKRKQQTISISGAFALYPLVVQWAEEYKKTHPDIRFNISGGGAGKGMADAMAGAVDLGMFSREISQEELNKGVWWVGLTIDAVLPTISDKNPALAAIQYQGLSQEELKALFIDGTLTQWDQAFGTTTNSTIAVYNRSDACGAAGTWAAYLGGKQEDLLGIGIFGDPGLAEAVSKDPSGVAFNNTIFIYDIKSGKKRSGIEVIPIDVNSNGIIDEDENFYESFESILNAIANGKYPSPPARELYFVANGKPENEVVLDFMRWTLTEGQQFIKAAGYVPISRDKIDSYLEKLK